MVKHYVGKGYCKTFIEWTLLILTDSQIDSHRKKGPPKKIKKTC